MERPALQSPPNRVPLRPPCSPGPPPPSWCLSLPVTFTSLQSEVGAQVTTKALFASQFCESWMLRAAEALSSTRDT